MRTKLFEKFRFDVAFEIENTQRAFCNIQL